MKERADCGRTRLWVLIVSLIEVFVSDLHWNLNGIFTVTFQSVLWLWFWLALLFYRPSILSCSHRPRATGLTTLFHQLSLTFLASVFESWAWLSWQKASWTFLELWGRFWKSYAKSINRDFPYSSVPCVGSFVRVSHDKFSYQMAEECTSDFRADDRFGNRNEEQSG